MNAEQHAYVVFTLSRHDRLTFSDGSTRLYPRGAGQGIRDDLLRTARLPYERWAAQQPRHWSAAHRAEQWERYSEDEADPGPLPVGEVEQVRGWRGHFSDAEKSRDLTELIETWSGGVPAVAIARALDAVSGQGWQVVSVTEDKAYYTGRETVQEDGPIAVRILLRRPAS